MRRLGVLPVKTSAVTVILLAGAVYGATEVREAVIRRQERELARLEENVPDDVAEKNPASGRSEQSIESRQIGTAASGSGRLTAYGTSDNRSVTEQQTHETQIQKSLNDGGASAREIIISIPDRQLALLENGKLIKTYPIAVGTAFTPSPEGEFTIINHAKDPTYRHKGKEIQPGRDNPLGSRWMGLSLKGYGIHGTNVPRSIGRAASHGCFRMARQDVEDLYERVHVGDKVKVRRERDAQIASLFTVQEHAPVQLASAEAQVVSPAGPQSGTQHSDNPGAN